MAQDIPDTAILDKPDTIAEVYLPHGPPVCTKAGFRYGVVFSAPYALGITVFGATAGMLAAKAGLTFTQAVIMNGTVYAGASQLAVLSHWPMAWTFSALLATALIALAINSRFILMSASLYPYFRHLKGTRPWVLLFLMTDFGWLLFLRAAQNHKENGRPPDLGFYIGFAAVMYCVWTLSAIPGWWIGSNIADLKRYALDLFALMFFASLLVPLWKGAAHARPWFVAGAVAALAHFFIPGSYYIVIGALAGAFSGAMLRA